MVYLTIGIIISMIPIGISAYFVFKKLLSKMFDNNFDDEEDVE